MTVMERLAASIVVPVVVLDKVEDAVPAAKAMAAGGVDTMEIGGELFSGVQLRSILKLPSTVFSVSADHQMITITTMGYGHRVGMSQYGANALAESGSTWQQILQHYYPDTALVPWG